MQLRFDVFIIPDDAASRVPQQSSTETSTEVPVRSINIGQMALVLE